MLTLAIDTSFQTVAVALMQDNKILYDAVINNGLNHSETLLPAIDDACRQLRLKINDIDLFACTLGPGSFTGLRVGVSTLKGLLIASGKPAVGVSSLAAVALNATDRAALIYSVMDAGRGHVYTASYRYNDQGLLHQITPEAVIDPRDILLDSNQAMFFVGDGAIKYRDIFRDKAGKVTIAETSQQHIRGSAVGVLGRDKFLSNELLNPAAFVPVYLRPADAKPGKPLFNNKT